MNCRREKAGLPVDDEQEYLPLSWLSQADYCLRRAALLLNERGRKTVLTAWRDRKQEEITHPYLGEKIQVGLIAYVQAMMLARVLRGDLDCYPPFVWR